MENAKSKVWLDNECFIRKAKFLTGNFVICILLSAAVSGQTSLDNTQRDVLPPLSSPVACGLALRYIDDALARAFTSGATTIFVVRSKNVQNIALARIRTSNLRSYVRFRGFENFEIAVDLETSEFEQIDIFVRGELLYSLPLKSNDRLKIKNC